MKQIMKRLLIINLLFIISLLVVLSGVFAWYQLTKFVPIKLSNGDFDVTMIVTFDNVEVGENSVFYDNTKKVIRINAFDENAENYIEKLKIDLEIRTDIAARFRMKIQDEWQLIRNYDYFSSTVVLYHEKTAEGSIDNPFIISDYEDFPYRVDSWNYIYYDGILLPDIDYSFNVIEKGTSYNVKTTESYYEECFVDLDLIFDIVQANRFSERWLIGSDFFD